MKTEKSWLAASAVLLLCAGVQAMAPSMDFDNTDMIGVVSQGLTDSNPSPAVGQAAAQDADLCSKNKELEARFYLFLYGDPKRDSDSLGVLFNYSSCSVSDRGGAHNEPIEPSATRAYIAKNPENPGGYNFLWIETIGGYSRFFIGQKDPDSGRTAQTYIAQVSNADILNGIVKLQNVFISDARAAHRDGFIGTLFITLTSPHKDGPIADPSIKPGPIPDASITAYRGTLFMSADNHVTKIIPLCFELSSQKDEQYPGGADDSNFHGAHWYFQNIPVFKEGQTSCNSSLDLNTGQIRDCSGHFLADFPMFTAFPNVGQVVTISPIAGVTDKLKVTTVGSYRLESPIPGDRCS